jgi:hypothetical protein
MARAGGWRSSILSHFSREVAAASRLTLVADPDSLLAEQGIIEGIHSNGYDVVPYEDHVAFRYAYETGYREPWDCGEGTALVVAVRAPGVAIENLPFDLLERARRDRRLLPFSVAALFPKLAPGVVSALERSDFDALWVAQENHLSETLGENGTKDFVLRHVFKVAPELINTPGDLLRTLLEKHYRARLVPRLLDERLIDTLQKSAVFVGWPLQETVPDRERFFLFLQERWPRFLEKTGAAKGEDVKEGHAEGWMAIPGPVDLPFDHSDVKVYIDDLFLEGLLQPIAGVAREPFLGSWMSVGIAAPGPEEELVRLRRLAELIERDLPSEDAESHAWVETALRWAELDSIRWTMAPEGLAQAGPVLASLRAAVDARFSSWLAAWYSSLASLTPWPRPVMVHQIPHWIAHGNTDRREALLVLDGLSLSQWTAFRPTLEKSWTIRESGVFAWIPTITSVSRQSIFAGAPPFYFGQSVGTTAREEQHWRRFWEDQDLSRNQIAYLCQKLLEPENTFVERIRDVAGAANCRRLGIVVGYVDQMMHGAVAGAAGLYSQLKQWAEAGHLRELVAALLKHGFAVTITSDHGNLEATGIGRQKVGVVADEKGERVLVFPDELTRRNLAEQVSGAAQWPTAGLPPGYFPLLAPGRGAFLPEGARAVTHGGSSLEEVIVPFIRIEAAQ